MLRLRRWLGSSASRRVVRMRAAQALKLCSEKMHCQRAFLHVLLGEYASAAKQLTATPGLGWSDEEHPGHVLFAIFCALLGGDASDPLLATAPRTERRMDPAAFLSADVDEPLLAAPASDEIIKLAAPDRPVNTPARKAMLRAMRNAAEKRVREATKFQRRGVYGHAARLVALCSALDSAPDIVQWVTGIRTEYRRFPALQRELDRLLS